MTYTQAKLLIQHWRAQLAMDCDNTGDAIRHIVRLNQRAKEADALRAALTTANARAEAAEAQLAAELDGELSKLRMAYNVLSDDCDELLDKLNAAEAQLAAVPVGAIRLVMWALSDGPHDEMAIDDVNRWLDARQPEAADQPLIPSLSDVVCQAGQMMGTIPPDDPAAREQYYRDIIAKLRHRARAAEAAWQEQRGRAEAAEAALALVEKYADYVVGSWIYAKNATTFAEWLAARQQPEAQP